MSDKTSGEQLRIETEDGVTMIRWGRMYYPANDHELAIIRAARMSVADELDAEWERAKPRTLAEVLDWSIADTADLLLNTAADFAAHDHREYVEGCYRCDLSRAEVTP